MIKLDQLWQTAIAKRGSRKAVQALLPSVLTSKALIAVTDDRYLSMMTRRVFRAGMTHRVVDAKWPAFEQRFFGFEPRKIVLMNPERLEVLMEDKAIIRHWTKMQTILPNAQLCLEISQQHGGVGSFLAQWPVDDIVGLWAWLGAHGQRLGGNSGAYFLRMAGKDTFVLTRHVVAALVREGVVDKNPTSKRALQQVQAAFNQWRAESGLPISHISQLLAFSVD